MSALTAAIVVPTPAYAQQITSSVRGTVVDGAGAPVARATVTVTDTRSGASRQVRTGANGQFQVSNLEVGGPYNVTVRAQGKPGQSVEDVYITLSGSTQLNFALEDRAASEDEVVVVATRSVLSQLAVGPSSQFSAEKLAELPSIGRDIRDIIRLDPRVRVDGSNADAVSCLGSNNRFNSFTIDGVRNADSFGLNNSGFVNRNGLPIPFDAIRETSVEFAPFDVEYGQFTGCNINVVTKSGGNEFSGSAFAVFSSQSLNGSTLEGRDVFTTPFRDYNWGATLGGPVIKDKLFFFVGYEEFRDNRPQDTGPADGGFGNGVTFATTADVDAISAALEARGIPTGGGVPSVLPNTSRRILTRWDWNITDNHRLAFTYQRLREAATSAEDQSFTNNRIALGSNFSKIGTNSETYSARLFSQWTDNLSTEIRVSRSDIEDVQDPVFGGEALSSNPIARVIVGVQNDLNGDLDFLDAGERGAIIAGPGRSRTANELNTQIDQLKFKADYALGDHTLTAGYELDQLDVFNVFVQDATGTLVFNNLADLVAGNLSLGTGGVATGGFNGALAPAGGLQGATLNTSPTGDLNDAAAIFSRSIHSLYAQDEWRVTDRLTAVLGLRYDFYKSNDRPNPNANFLARYGFDNSQGYDGLDAFLPRLGFNYDAGETFFGETNFRLGAGVFTGGDPTVWFSNAFSNPGNTLSGFVVSNPTNCTPAQLQLGASGALQAPACLTAAAQAAAATSDGRADAIDPDFKLPTIIRANFGFTHNTNFGGAFAGVFDDWTAQIDVLYSAGRNSVDFVDASLTQIGTAVDGRPIFGNVNPLAAGCTATSLGLRNGFVDGSGNPIAAGSPCLGGTIPAAQDTIVLTNAVEGNRQFTVSGSFSKDYEFDSPIFKRPASLSLLFGYAFTDAEDATPATSSVSLSNFQNVAVSNPDGLLRATSNYETRHNVVANLTYGEEFVKDLETSFAFFFQARSGTPYSLTFNNGNAFGDTSGSNRSLLYIPTGPTDPNVSFGAGFGAAQQTAFFDLISQLGLDEFRGQIIPRNALRSDWFLDLDFRFQQELPSIAGVRPKFFVDIENLPNLITDEANIFRQRQFPQTANIVTLGSAANPGAAPFQYNAFLGGNAAQQIISSDSLWAVQFGLRFDF